MGKDLGKLLFKTYGISEWEEKCIILTAEEQRIILKALVNNEFNHLVELVKLPYPKFACEYVKSYRSNIWQRDDGLLDLDEYLMQLGEKYSDFGYKLYMMPRQMQNLLINYIRNPKQDIYLLAGTNSQACNFKILLEYLRMPIEDGYKILYTKKYNINSLRRFIHIMQYVDAEEAEKLGLNGFTFKKFDKYRGFDMGEKLDALNPLIRHIVMEVLGLNGAYVTINDVEAELNLPEHGLDKLFIDRFYLALTKSSGEFKNYIGLIDKKYKPDEKREYTAKSQFKKVTDKIERDYITGRLKSQEETADLSLNDIGVSFLTPVDKADDPINHKKI